MANKTRNPGIARPAAADLTGKLYHFGKIVSGEKIALAGVGEHGYPMTEVGQAGRGITIEISGMSKITCGGVIAVGDHLKPDANGKAVKAAADEKSCGVAIEAGVLNQVIEFRIDQGIAKY